MQVPGSMYTRRRLRRTVLRRWRLLTAIVSALALVAGLLVFYAVHAGEGPAPAADPGSPVAVHVVHGRKVPIPPMRAFRRAAAVWPTAQTATVIVTGATVRAGSTRRQYAGLCRPWPA